MIIPVDTQEIERNFNSNVVKEIMYGYGYKVTLEDDRVYWVFGDEDTAKKEAWTKVEFDMLHYPEVYEEHLKDYLYMPTYLKEEYAYGVVEDSVENMPREEILHMMNAENPLDLRAKIQDLKDDLLDTENPEVEKQIYEVLKQTKKDLEMSGDFEKLKEGLAKVLAKEIMQELKDPYQYFVKEHQTYENLEKLLQSGLAKVNWNDAIEEFLALDDFGVHLSPYDGKELYLDGMYAYRQE